MKVQCIDDSARPESIPLSYWIKKDMSPNYQSDWTIMLLHDSRLYMDVLGEYGERHFTGGHRHSIHALNYLFKTLKRK